MEHDFWHERWTQGQIGFHEPQANALLVRWFDALELSAGQRIFLPLCGKTLDIHWLLERGMHVVGVELSELAVRQLFDELGVAPAVSHVGALKRYSAVGIDVFVGDIFSLDADTLGSVDAIYDRAALVALPDAMRVRYAEHLVSLTDRVRQLVICVEYDQAVMNGPPFAIHEADIRSYYDDVYQLESLARISVAGGLKGRCPAHEQVWLLTR
ncbi:MAG: thiopurine S-methyltransferase [Pseudomonadota bacterium]